MTKLVIACALLLTGCGLQSDKEYKCINNIIYIKEGGMWVSSGSIKYCHPLEETK